jgi:hypothetical protein
MAGCWIATSRVVGQAKGFSAEISQGVKRARSVLEQLALEGLRQELDLMASRVRQVMETDQGTYLPRQPAQSGQAPEPVRAIDLI